MATDNDLDALADAIAARALSHLRAERVGREEPCTAGPRTDGPRERHTSDSQPGGAEDVFGPHPLSQQRASRVGIRPAELRTPQDLAGYIDHTLLKPDATHDEIVKLCEEARQHEFATVCVNAGNVALAARLLAGSNTMAIAVVGFPLGATTPSTKAFEAREAVRAGAGEIDMVINIGALKSKDYRLVGEDIAAVVKASAPAPVKVILETSELTQEEKIIACALSKAAGAAFVKTSTGFSKGGATAEDIALMRRIVGPDLGVKASGGVRSEEDARRMIAAGADRLGASASVAIVTGQKSNAKY